MRKTLNLLAIAAVIFVSNQVFSQFSRPVQNERYSNRSVMGSNLGQLQPQVYFTNESYNDNQRVLYTDNTQNQQYYQPHSQYQPSRVMNTINTINQVLNIFGQVMQLYEQGRENRYRRSQYYQNYPPSNYYYNN
jgi:hypothetical protein